MHQLLRSWKAFLSQIYLSKISVDFVLDPPMTNGSIILVVIGQFSKMFGLDFLLRTFTEVHMMETSFGKLS